MHSIRYAIIRELQGITLLRASSHLHFQWEGERRGGEGGERGGEEGKHSLLSYVRRDLANRLESNREYVSTFFSFFFSFFSFIFLPVREGNG